MRKIFLSLCMVSIVVNTLFALYFPMGLWTMLILGPLIILGTFDMTQKNSAVLRNFPVIGNFRFWLESIRPEISQYFIESNSDGVPFSREQRSVIYQRAKKELDTLPFGSQKNFYEVGYEWLNHSLHPQHLDPQNLRVRIGGPDCTQPYNASIFNVSAMSFGALSKNAILALNAGAKLGGFAHNTGEGGLSPYHLENEGDLIWQIGTGYFSCRNSDGSFNEKLFSERANLPQVKMIELKLSQGAKPGHGGILPAAKVTAEISKIRGVEMDKDVRSPAAHTEFSNPIGLLQFIERLRKLSDGKPVGFKLCLGKRREFIAICKAMIQTGITPDFITIDGGEGGTGAAPLEFSNHIGAPLREALIFIHNSLIGFSLREKIKIIASGKVTTGFDIVSKLALGADMCNSARAMMMALGCIQALRCNTNKCPVGVATQDPDLVVGLSIPNKKDRVASFHKETVKSLAEILGAMGLASASEVRPWHLMRRISGNEVKHYGELYNFLNGGELLGSHIPEEYHRAFHAASPDSFSAQSYRLNFAA